MCGFAEFLLVQPGSPNGREALATCIANAIAHRGPDDAGSWADADAGIALGHLSVVSEWQDPGIGVRGANRSVKEPVSLLDDPLPSQGVEESPLRALIDRANAGFRITAGQLLRGALRFWAEALLNAQRLQVEVYFCSAPIIQKWAEHLTGARDHTAVLRAVLMCQTWPKGSE